MKPLKNSKLKNGDNNTNLPRKKTNKPFGDNNTPLVRHKEESKWFDYQVDAHLDEQKNQLPQDAVHKLLAEADELYQKDVELHMRMVRSGKSENGADGEGSWLLSVVKKGTASDRLTAMQLQIHKSPVHSLLFAGTMVDVLNKKVTREAMEIIPILQDAFVHHYLPSSRKLISFSLRPLSRLDELSSNNKRTRQKILVLWAFEHKLKQLYIRFIQALEQVSSGVVEDLTRRSLKAAMNLLAERPEGEQQLLTMLVNKLGHANYKIGAYMSTLLEELSRRQPAMRPIIVKEVERLIYRKNVSDRAHLYSITFLSQMALRSGEADLAVHLLGIYFGLFKTLVSHGNTNNRLLATLLAASNRAIPYAKEKADSLSDEIDTLYKVVHVGSFPVALQTLRLLFQILKLSDNVSDRFFTALYRKLFDPIPATCYNQLMLLLFQALQADSSVNRVRSFVKRLLQLALQSPSTLAAGILIMVSRLAEKNPSLLVPESKIDQAAKIMDSLTIKDEDEEHFIDYDIDGKPINRANKKEEEDELIEIPVDEQKMDEKKPIKGLINGAKTSGWVHTGGRHERSPYDHSARNPLFVDCRNTPDSELLLLSSHYHPSVAIFAQTLLEGRFINYRGDPLLDFAMIGFLDRFAYKNPKENKARTADGRVVRKKAYDPWGVRKLSIMSKEYVGKNVSELPPDERYLHRFAQLKFQDRVKTEKEDDWEISSVASDEFDALLEKFEPGELNDCFDIEFGKEFSAEKKKKGAKRAAEEEVDIDEDEDLDDDEGADFEDDEHDEPDDDEENDEDIEMESDVDEDEERAFIRQPSGGHVDSDQESDEDYGNADADVAADRFGAIMEDFGGHEDSKQKKNKKRSAKQYKFKKRRR